MKNIIKTVLILALIFGFQSIMAQDYHVRIGTIGNSITHGNAYGNPQTDAYPVHLQDSLAAVYGDTCIVRNFGLTTTTMLKNGDVSYWDTQHWQDYLAYAPEICFIMLGTNDSKDQNWDVYGDEFYDDYLAMIDSIKARNPNTKFILAYPPPAFAVKWSIRDSVIVNGVIPAIDSVLDVVEAELVDFYNPLLDREDLFPDQIHPNTEGAMVMAGIIKDKMIESDIVHEAVTGMTFITSFETDKQALAQGDSATLRWTSINADSVFFDGVLVDDTASVKVAPDAATTYTLIAKGELSSDTVLLAQEVYVPELNTIRISPSRISGYETDTLSLSASYLDQMGAPMNSEEITTSWSVFGGSGYLINIETDQAEFVTETVDTSYVVVSSGDLADTARVITRASTTALSTIVKDRITLYPNPATNELILDMQQREIDEIQVYDMKGRLLTNQIKITRLNKKIVSMEINSLSEGNYVLQAYTSEGIITRKFTVSR